MLPKWHPICVRTGRITPQVTHTTKDRKMFCGKLLDSGQLNSLFGLFLVMPLGMQGFSAWLPGFFATVAGIGVFPASCWKRCFPTCQVRVVRFYVSLPLLLLFFFLFSSSSSWSSSSSSSPTAMIEARCFLPDLNRDDVSSVFLAGPQPRSCELSVPCRTSALRPGPQPRWCELSVLCPTWRAHVLSQQGQNERARKVSTCRPDAFSRGVFQSSKFFLRIVTDELFMRHQRFKAFSLTFLLKKCSPKFSFRFLCRKLFPTAFLEL